MGQTTETILGRREREDITVRSTHVSTQQQFCLYHIYEVHKSTVPGGDLHLRSARREHTFEVRNPAERIHRVARKLLIQNGRRYCAINYYIYEVYINKYGVHRKHLV